MDDFEKQLRQALSREEPSAFFEARVLAAVRQSGSRTSSRMWWMSAVAAVFVVVCTVVTSSAWQCQRDEVAGKRAKAQLDLALKVTSMKLQEISKKVKGIEENQ